MAPTTTHSTDLADMFEEARLAEGWSYHAVERLLIPILGDDTPAAESLRLYHIEIPRKRPDPFVLAALCDLYHVPFPDDLYPNHRAREILANALLRNRWSCFVPAA
jgi:hypothetical protein